MFESPVDHIQLVAWNGKPLIILISNIKYQQAYFLKLIKVMNVQGLKIGSYIPSMLSGHKGLIIANYIPLTSGCLVS